jgi:hypothetical protein
MRMAAGCILIGTPESERMISGHLLRREHTVPGPGAGIQ